MVVQCSNIFVNNLINGRENGMISTYVIDHEFSNALLMIAIKYNNSANVIFFKSNEKNHAFVGNIVSHILLICKEYVLFSC